MRNLSLISTSLAILCAIHCALMPIFFSLTPFIASKLVGYHWLEWVMIGSSFILGGIPIIRAYSRHENRWPIGVLIAGVSLILLDHQLHIPLLAYALTILGALLLTTAQLYNAYLLRQYRCKTCVN